MTVKQFSDLLEQTEPAIKAHHTRKNELKLVTGRPRVVSDADMLMLCLIWLRQAFTENQLSWIFNLTQSQCHYYLQTVLTVLNNRSCMAVQIRNFFAVARSAKGESNSLILWAGQISVLIKLAVEERIC